MIGEKNKRLEKQLICRNAAKLVANSRFEEAFALYSRAIDLDPTDYRQYLNRSYCCQQLNQLPEALKDADSGIAINDANISGHYRKGCVLLCLKHFRSAEKSFQTALSFDENDANSKLKLIETKRLFLKEFGFADKEIDQLVEALNTCSDISDALITGELIQKLKECDIGSESVASAESPRVEPSLKSMSFPDYDGSDVQSITSEDLSFTRSSNGTAFNSLSNSTQMDENEVSIRVPKTNPFAKRLSQQNRSPVVAAIGAQQLNDSTHSTPNLSSNESTPTSRTRLVKTRPQIRIKSID